MRWLRAKGARGVAWVGVLALALNALVPVHLAFDLVEALGPAHQERHEAAFRRVLALVVLHDADRHDADQHDGDRQADADHHAGHHHGGHHHDTECPVCNALGSLAAYAMPAAPVLALPVATIAAAAALPAEIETAAAFPAGYRSRAPPPA